MSAAITAENGGLKLAGVVDFANADTCCSQGLALLEKLSPNVVVDLAALESASTVSVAVLLRWARRAAARQGRLQLAHVPEKCRAILRVSGLADALPEIS